MPTSSPSSGSDATMETSLSSRAVPSSPTTRISRRHQQHPPDHDGSGHSSSNDTIQKGSNHIAVESLSRSPSNQHRRQQQQQPPSIVTNFLSSSPSLTASRHQNGNGPIHNHMNGGCPSPTSVASRQSRISPMTVTLSRPTKVALQRRRQRRHCGACLVLALVVLCYRSVMVLRQSARLLGLGLDDDDDDTGDTAEQGHDYDGDAQQPLKRSSLLTSLSDFDLSIVRDGVARAADRLKDSFDDDVGSWEEGDDNDDDGKDDDDDDERGTANNGEAGQVDEAEPDESKNKNNSMGGIRHMPDQTSSNSERTEPSIPVIALPVEDVDGISSKSLTQRLWHGLMKSNPFRQSEPVIAKTSLLTINATSSNEQPFGNNVLVQPGRRPRPLPRRIPHRAGMVYPAPPNPTVVEDKIQELLHLYPDACRDKEPYLRIVLSASDAAARRVQAGKDSMCRSLPTHAQVVAKYGAKPVIVGLETCQAYRELLSPTHNEGRQLEPMPRVAGLYHCGTNALCRSFNENIKRLPRKPFSPYEVPWGKHLPPAVHRLNNRFPADNAEDQERVLPIVIVRDPFFWFQSMCKVRYDAKWEKEPNNRCPNFIRVAQNRTTWSVECKTHQTAYKKVDNYTSLADMWNDWHMQYLDADYPRLMIRFEDTLYRLEEVVNEIRECIGMDPANSFKYMISRSKGHGSPTDFVTSLTKQVSSAGRHKGLNAEDRKYAHEILNPRLMNTFGYEQCPLEEDPADLTGPYLGWRIRDPADRGQSDAVRVGNLKSKLKFRPSAPDQMSDAYKERYALMRQRKEEMMQRIKESRETKANELIQRGH